MNNDLISREALKKAIIEHRYDYVEDNFFWTKLFNIIDNAPTVNLEKRSFIEGYKEGCEFGKKCYERPQGEWIKEYKDFKCSLCGKIAYSWNDHGTYIQIKSDFCPHCGADMRGAK